MGELEGQTAPSSHTCLLAESCDLHVRPPTYNTTERICRLRRVVVWCRATTSSWRRCNVDAASTTAICGRTQFAEMRDACPRAYGICNAVCLPDFCHLPTTLVLNHDCFTGRLAAKLVKVCRGVRLFSIHSPCVDNLAMTSRLPNRITTGIKWFFSK